MLPVKSILLLLTLSTLSWRYFAQGTDCASAITVSATGCSAAAAYNNTGVAGTLSNSTCFTTGTNNGMWFKFVAVQPTAVVTINGGSLTGPQLSLLSAPATGCAAGGTFTELSCATSATTSTTLTYSALTIGNTYYVYVDGQNNNVGTFQVCISSPTQPLNDNPCNPFSVPANNFCSSAGAYTNVGATTDNLFSVSLPSCWTTTGSFNTVFFQFTATGTSNQITVTGGSAGLQLPQVAILQATTCSGTAWTMNGSTSCGAPASGNTVTLNANNLTIGQTYLIAVDGKNNNTGSFQLCVNSYQPTAGPANDLCANATPLCPNGFYTATTTGATNTGDVAIAKWNCNGVLDNAVWFTYVANTPVQDVTFNLDGACDGGALQFEVFKFTGTGNPCNSPNAFQSIGCDDAIINPSGSGSVTIPAAQMVAGQTYYVLTDNYPGNTCNYTFSISGNAGANAGADVTMCTSASPLALSGTPAGGTWTGPGVSGGNFNPTTTGTGTYTLFYNNGVCTDQKLITVTGVDVVVSNDVTICTGQSTSLIGNVANIPGTGPVTFTNTTDFAVPDNNTTGATSTITISNISPATVSANPIVSVCMNISHTWLSDLDIFLKCPGGTQIDLTSDNGGSSDNYTNTCFTASASTLITAGAAPFTGNFTPEAALSGLNACNINGVWSLIVKDDTGGDTGTLLDWSITFNNTDVATYTWTSNPVSTLTNPTSSLTQTVSPTVTTTYTLTAQNGAGCSDNDQVIVTVVTNPTASIVSNNGPICAGSNAVFNLSGTANAVVTYTVNGGSNQTVTLNASGTASVTISSITANQTLTLVSVAAGTCSQTITGTSTVTVTPAPTFSVTSTNPTTCGASNGTLVLSGLTAGTTYSLTYTAGTGAVGPTSITPSAATYTINNLSAGSYSNVVLAVGTCSTTLPGPWVLTNPSGPNLVVTNPAAVCAPGTVNITLPAVTQGSSNTGPLTYFTDAACTNTLTTPSAITLSGTYYIKTTLNGCSDTEPVTVVINNGPTLSVVGSNPTTCGGTNGSITISGLQAGTNYSLTYLDASVSVGPTAINSSGTGTYIIMGLNAGSYTNFSVTGGTCPGSTPGPVNLSEPGAPTLVISNPAAVCSPNTVDITAASVTAGSSPSSGLTFTYFTDAACTSVLTNPSAISQSNTYYIKGTTSSGCVDIETVVVTINQTPSLTIVDPAAVCAPNTVDITVPQVITANVGNGTLSYWTNANGTGAIATPSGIAVGGTYYIQSANGTCKDIEPVVVVVNPAPTVVITPPAAVCSPNTVNLSAAAVTAGSTPGTVFTYFTNAAGTTPIANPSAVSTSATYWIKGTLNGCSSMQSVLVTIKPSPILMVSDPAPKCTPNTVDITTNSVTAGSTAGVSYTYFTDLNTMSPLASPNALITSGTYVIVCTLNQCTDTATVNVVVNQTPVVNAGPDTVICLGGSVTLTATGATTYSWNNGVTNGVPFSPVIPNNYTVTGTSNGCSSSDVVSVTVNAIPTVDAGMNDTICEGESVTLTGSGATNYLWDNSVTDGQSFVPSVGTHLYTVTGTVAGGCSDQDQVTVIVYPNPVISFTPDITSGCLPLTVTFTNTTANAANCSWSFGNGQVLNGCGTVTATYLTEGCFDVTLQLEVDRCSASYTQQDLICTEATPNAAFTASQYVLTEYNSDVDFENQTTGASSYYWTFGDGSVPSSVVNPHHDYAGSPIGPVVVTLVASSQNGCVDTARVNILIEEELIFWVPNSFTPDDDNFNPVFQPVFYSGFDPYNYKMQIFDRWGELVFETNDLNYGWDGSYGSLSEVSTVQDGAYTWKIEFKLKQNDEHRTVVGHVNVLR